MLANALRTDAHAYPKGLSCLAQMPVDGLGALRAAGMELISSGVRMVVLSARDSVAHNRSFRCIRRRRCVGLGAARADGYSLTSGQASPALG